MPYTPQVGTVICEGLAAGQSLRAICKGEGMPAPSTVCLWVRENPDFAEQYARAREAQADHYADEIIEIADRAEDANLARVQIDARKWFASKVAAKKYGDKVTNEHTGSVTVELVKFSAGQAPG